MATAEFMRLLGLDPKRRAVIVHADDVGMCHGANTAFVELSRSGALTCGSVMVPCPWFPEIARIAAGEPALDLGVHLTLTSEWAAYRWAPLTRLSPSSGLVDDEGYFHRTVAALAAGVEPEAAEAEMRAQIDRALSFGIDITHIDTHMGAALCPQLVDAYCRVGRDYRLPVLLPRDNRYCLNVLKLDALGAREIWDEAINRLHTDNVPLVDDFRMTPGVAHEESETAYRSLVADLPEGLTFLALHPNSPGDIEMIVPPRAHFRTDEHRLLGSGRVTEWLESESIQTVGMRPLRELYRRQPERQVR
ncbi:MAG: ChbG/HpnK family deacetylase [Sphingomonas sp.]|nr:ChbG/HpnK family deacetylase [Sphingomonas sp.]